jgi:hypothetical protein
MAGYGSHLPRKVQVPKSKAASSCWGDCRKSKCGHRFICRRSSGFAFIPIADNTSTANGSSGHFQLGINVSIFIRVSLLRSARLSTTY